ncbi:mucin-17-like [Aedes albopictus]|uniref:PHD-type domain-containing protein n=1 Tax=Aedes albopictus TaxID=7160 RepID=A0ABM1ZGG8_AEDAL
MPETDRFDCKLCQRSNNVDDMVFCAVCQEWYHYQCVGVTSAIANESWMCARCAALPSSTRIGELSGSDLVFPATNVNVSSTMTTDPPLAVAPNSSVVTIATNSGFTLAGTAAFSTASSTVPPGLVPPAVAGPSGRVPAMMISTTTTNYGQPLLTEQARASLQWVQEHRAFLEQQLEESHKKELERKKAMLSQLANNALQGVISGAASNSFNEQSAAVGVGNVGGWLGRMIDEMDNLSITPVSTGPQVTTPVTPVFNNSSTPTTAGSANQYVFDPSFSSLMFGVPSSMSRVSTGPVSAGQCSTTPSIPLYGYSPPGGDHPRQISAFPISTQVSSMDLRNANMTNVVTACPTIPTVSIPQPSVYGGFSVNASAPRLNQNPIVSQAPVGGYYPASSALPSSFPGPVGPTQQQLLARQVMPRDLPPFRGDPEDWPLFFSAYTNSTAACGYSNVENLARLQRALQGKAFEAVKSRLLLPACVPHVMSTLYMLYGRPELIIQTLLDKVRETPAPRADRLETLITFGMAVQNLCDHIEATGQMAHMCNPVLLRELVDKIPAQLRLNWALYKQQLATADLRTR